MTDEEMKALEQRLGVTFHPKEAAFVREHERKHKEMRARLVEMRASLAKYGTYAAICNAISEETHD